MFIKFIRNLFFNSCFDREAYTKYYYRRYIKSRTIATIAISRKDCQIKSLVLVICNYIGRIYKAKV
jgi:hypothetical protein